ncbi:MBL fold metallo-hydrolase [Butyrivibrio sp. FC2001]|nr:MULTISPECIES: MBL fold metallo-hydrolase [unclassified Butyrivibrio]
MINAQFTLTILGARGSIPVSGSEYNEYGGATSCYMVEAGDQVIFLDAGTGIINAPNLDDKENIYVLLSHPHLDHIIGLPFFSELSKKNRTITLYGKKKRGKSIDLQIEKAYSPPYWPLTIAEYPSDFKYVDLELPLIIKDQGGDITVDGIKVSHPGGNLGLSISYREKKLVYLTDCELSEEPDNKIVEFAKGADLLLCDAQYTREEYDKRIGYGHSTPEMASKLSGLAGVKQTLFIHHDPFRDDKAIHNLERKTQDKNIRFARAGEKIILG